MAASDFKTAANPQQLKAIETTEGPVLIIAGPGSGKTFTLVERVVYLITQKQVAPENLLVVTFTDKAAQELVTRISNRLDALGVRFNLNEMYLGTFHSICLRWLDEYREFTRLKRNYTLLDEFDQRYFVYERLDEYLAIDGIEHVVGDSKHRPWPTAEALIKCLNMVGEEALDVEVLLQAPDVEVRVLAQCSVVYQRQLAEDNALDFSTIQSEALKLLRNQPQVLAGLRQKLMFLMVDEYQDTNTIQEEILTLLGGPQPNLCVVGDDDQGLYRFRGATIRNILQFSEKYPGQCQQISLNVNYRSHRDIVRFFRRWILSSDWRKAWRVGGTIFRLPKGIRPDPTAQFPDGPVVLKVSAATAEAYHTEVLEFLHTLKARGHLTDWNQVAFLFRSVKNDRAVALSKFLEDNGITVYSPRSNQFFEREEIRLMIGALIFLFPQFPEVRQWKPEASLDIWSYYDEECFKLFAEKLRDPANNDLLKWARTRAKQHTILVENADYAFTGLFYQLLRFPLFSQFLGEERLRGGVTDSRAMRNLAMFSQLLGKFEYLNHISVLTPEYLTRNLRGLFNQFLRFLKDGGIDEYEDQADYAPSGCVSFFTIHQSKGLEFPVVIVDSLDAGPRKSYTPLDEILERGYLLRPPFEPLAHTKYFDFRRLFYTAFSRAQNLLVFACQEVSTGSHRSPSKYFTEYFDGLPTWRDPAFKAETVPLAAIKDVNLKREYSFTSHLTLYENCAEQYRFFRELEFAPIRTSPILFGTLVHETIEDIHKTVLRGEEQRLSEDQVAAWFDTNYAYLTRRERVYLAPAVKHIALQQVLRYYRRQAGDWSRIKDAEVDVSLVKDEYILTGKVDLITGEQGTVELVDFKSEKKPDVNDPKDREKIDRYHRQLEVYAHIVAERTGLTVSKLHLYYTSAEAGNPYISFPVNAKSITKTIDTFDAIVHRIEQQDFSIPERPAKLCKDCDMRHYCDAKNWKFRRKA